MKIRKSFVTNSSSVSYIITLVQNRLCQFSHPFFMDHPFLHETNYEDALDVISSQRINLEKKYNNNPEMLKDLLRYLDCCDKITKEASAKGFSIFITDIFNNEDEYEFENQLIKLHTDGDIKYGNIDIP